MWVGEIIGEILACSSALVEADSSLTYRTVVGDFFDQVPVTSPFTLPRARMIQWILFVHEA